MARLICPHCNGAVIANPIGRWYSKFQCPHCSKALRFDAKTNVLGVAGSLCFMAGGVTLIMARGPTAPTVIAVLAAAWIVLTGLSFALRGVEKG